MVGEGKSAGACDHRMKGKLSKLAIGLRQKLCQCFLDIGEMTLVICEKQGVVFIKYCDFDSGGTNVNSNVYLFIALLQIPLLFTCLQ